MAKARAALARHRRERRDAVLADAVTVTQAAEQLNIAPDDVAALLSAGALVAVDDRGRPMLPTWQFDTDRPGGRCHAPASS